MSDFRDHLAEHLEDPGFKATWESEADLREKMGREVEARLCRQFGTTLEEIEADAEKYERGDFSRLTFSEPIEGRPGASDSEGALAAEPLSEPREERGTGSEGPYAPIKLSLDDPRVKHPVRDSEGVMIWDDPDPDLDGDIYEQFADR